MTSSQCELTSSLFSEVSMNIIYPYQASSMSPHFSIYFFNSFELIWLDKHSSRTFRSLFYTYELRYLHLTNLPHCCFRTMFSQIYFWKWKFIYGNYKRCCILRRKLSLLSIWSF